MHKGRPRVTPARIDDGSRHVSRPDPSARRSRIAIRACRPHYEHSRHPDTARRHYLMIILRTSPSERAREPSRIKAQSPLTRASTWRATRRFSTLSRRHLELCVMEFGEPLGKICPTTDFETRSSDRRRCTFYPREAREATAYYTEIQILTTFRNAASCFLSPARRVLMQKLVLPV